MRIGAALFLIGLGAILKFAVTKHTSGIDLNVVGVILMIVGAIGLLAELVLMSTRRRHVVYGARTTRVIEEPPPPTIVDRPY